MLDLNDPSSLVFSFILNSHHHHHHHHWVASNTCSPVCLQSQWKQKQFGQLPTSLDFLCTDHLLLPAPPAVFSFVFLSIVRFPRLENSKRFDRLALPQQATSHVPLRRRTNFLAVRYGGCVPRSGLAGPDHILLRFVVFAPRRAFTDGRWPPRQPGRFLERMRVPFTRPVYVALGVERDHRERTLAPSPSPSS